MYLCGYMHVTAHLKLEGTNPPPPRLSGVCRGRWVCACTPMHLCHQHMYGDQKTIVGVSSLSLCGSWVLDSDHKASAFTC